MKAVCCCRAKGIVAVVEVADGATRISIPKSIDRTKTHPLENPELVTQDMCRYFRLWDIIADVPLFLEECDLRESVGWVKR